MWKSWIRPIAAIAVVWLSAEVYLDAPALAEESPQYAA